jgi:hypothetical protein
MSREITDVVFLAMVIYGGTKSELAPRFADFCERVQGNPNIVMTCRIEY